MRHQLTLHIICINFQVVFFVDNFWECATLNAFHEEIFKLHFFYKLVYKGRCGTLFCYLVWFHTRLVHVTQHAVRQYIWTTGEIKLIWRNYRQYRLFLGLVRTSITPHNSPDTIEVLIFPYNLSPKSHTMLCFSSAPRYLIQVTQSLIFKNLEIIRFCAKLRVHKRFRI